MIYQNHMQDEEYWRSKLTPEQFKVMRERGTEAPFSGEYCDNHRSGVYQCAACNEKLFSSDTKFDSGSGWPSFWESVGESKVKLQDDYSHGMYRIEATCAKCGSHLGHVFDDGPKPTGKRYCINSLSLKFIPTEEK